MLLNGGLPLWYFIVHRYAPLQQTLVVDSHRTLPEGVASIVLTNELPPQELRKIEALSTVRKPAARCTMVGPFAGLEGADRFVARLQVLDVQAFVQNLELPGGPVYRVHLPALNSQRDARQVLAQLHAEGVDSYLISRGDLANGIFLGVFSQGEEAQARVRELKSLGWQAEIQKIDRTYHEIWVMFAEGEAQKIARKTWWEWLDDEKSFEERQNFCLDVASEENFL